MKSMTVFSYIWCCIYLFRFRNYHSNIRTKDAIEATGAYDRPQYDPGPSHCRCYVRFNTSYSFKLNSCNLITVYVKMFPSSQDIATDKSHISKFVHIFNVGLTTKLHVSEKSFTFSKSSILSSISPNCFAQMCIATFGLA